MFRHKGPLGSLWAMFTGMACFGVACVLAAVLIGVALGAFDSAGAFAAMCGAGGFGFMCIFAGAQGRRGVTKKERQLSGTNNAS